MLLIYWLYCLWILFKISDKKLRVKVFPPARSLNGLMCLCFGNVWKFRQITKSVQSQVLWHCIVSHPLDLYTSWYFYGHGISGIVNNSCTFTSQRYQHWTTYSYTGRTALLTVFRNWFGFLPQSVAAASVLAVSIFWRVLASPLTTIISILSCPLFPFLVSIFLSCPFSEGFWRRQP